MHKEENNKRKANSLLAVDNWCGFANQSIGVQNLTTIAFKTVWPHDKDFECKHTSMIKVYFFELLDD